MVAASAEDMPLGDGTVLTRYGASQRWMEEIQLSPVENGGKQTSHDFVWASTIPGGAGFRNHPQNPQYE